MKWFCILLIPILFSGCATPVWDTNKALHTYDQNTEYSIDQNNNGFTITVLYSRYQFIPESDVVLAACKSNTMSIAYEIAEAQGRKIKPINEQRIKISMGRNGITGITSCTATVFAEYESSATAVQDSPKEAIRIFGTGFFISKDGLLLTAAHVVEDAVDIKVYWQDGEYPAKKVFTDTALDTAILKVSGSFHCLPIVASNTVNTGDSVFTLGFPLIQLQGTEPKFTDGSISSLTGIANDPKYFQISVPVQPGNSGGPLLNNSGHVIGIVNSRLDDLKTLQITGAIPQNVNYALKSSFVISLIESLPNLIDKLEKPLDMTKSEAIKSAQRAVALIVSKN